MPYAVGVPDIEARWRPLSSAESDVVVTHIDDLLLQLDILRPNLSAIYEATTGADRDRLDRAIAKTIAACVKRGMRNVDTLSNATIGGDGGIGQGFDNKPESIAVTQVYLDRADLATIDGAVATVLEEAAPVGWRSVRLRAHGDLYPGDIRILPTP